MQKHKIGLIINPIAGMGGSVGLKGTDGKDILEKAKKLGAEPKSHFRCQLFLDNLSNLKDSITIVTTSGAMGENLLKKTNFDYCVLSININNEINNETTREHTILAAKEMTRIGIHVLVFVGGDGTARDIFEAVGTSVPCIGIPAGVKIHSSVFAVNPESAAVLLQQFIAGSAQLKESEVMDIDEDAFRNNLVVSKLYGYLITPYLPQFVQSSKMASPNTESEHDNQKEIAEFLVEMMEPNTYYLLGPGTTVRSIAEILDVEKTLLGVDLIRDKKIIKKDLNERQILELLRQVQDQNNEKVKLIVTPIGAQGFVFGRGNLQVSDKVLSALKPENIIIVCTRYKFSTLPDGKLRIDSRNPEVDAQFRGYYKVIVGYGIYKIVEMV
jgi:predicted polyphosphate/ATP-dependent NAD kinase